MGGRMSRNKGLRVEREVKEILRTIGFKDAVRVPLSGASEGFKGDVVYTDTYLNKQKTVEVKARKHGFKTIYKKYVNKIVHHKDLGSFAIYDPLYFSGNAYMLVEETLSESQADYRMFMNLFKLKGSADFLAIKQDNHPVLFVVPDFYGDRYGS